MLPVSVPKSTSPLFRRIVLRPVKKKIVGTPPGSDETIVVITKSYIPWMPPHTRPAVQIGDGPGGHGTTLASKWPTTGLQP